METRVFTESLGFSSIILLEDGTARLITRDDEGNRIAVYSAKFKKLKGKSIWKNARQGPGAS